MSPRDRDAGPACGWLNLRPLSLELEMRKRTFSRVPEGLTNAAFALFGVLITGLVNYVSVTQAASVAGRQSCVARIDQREAVLRQKAESFMVALAGTAAPSTHLQVSYETIEKASDELLRSAYAFSSYADEHLGGLTELLALQISKRLDVSGKKETSAESENFLAQDSQRTLEKWRKTYREFMLSLETSRDKC